MFKTTCPKCNAKLQFPLLDSQNTMVRCPVCKQTFHPATAAQVPQQAQLQKNYGKFIGIAIAGLVVLGVIFLMGPLFDSGSKNQVQNQPAPATAQSQSTPPVANVTHSVPPPARLFRLDLGLCFDWHPPSPLVSLPLRST